MALGAKVSSTARESRRIRGTGSLDGALQAGFPATKLTVCAIWDDTIDGHIPVQVSNGGLGLGVFVPANFIVVNVDFDVQVVPVGPTNIFASLEADFDLIASAAISGVPWSTTGIKSGANVNAGAVNVAKTVQGPRTTAVREVQIGGTVATSSAGRIVIWLEGYISSALTQGLQ